MIIKVLWAARARALLRSHGVRVSVSASGNVHALVLPRGACVTRGPSAYRPDVSFVCVRCVSGQLEPREGGAAGEVIGVKAVPSVAGGFHGHREAAVAGFTCNAGLRSVPSGRVFLFQKIAVSTQGVGLAGGPAAWSQGKGIPA